MTTTPLSIAEQLRTAIRESGMSLSELARRSDLTQPGLSKFMSGGSLKIESAEALARALSIKTLKVPPT